MFPGAAPLSSRGPRRPRAGFCRPTGRLGASRGSVGNCPAVPPAVRRVLCSAALWFPTPVEVRGRYWTTDFRFGFEVAWNKFTCRGCSALPLVVQRPLDVDAHRDQAGGAIHRVCLAPGHLRQTHPRRPSAYVRPNHAPLNIYLHHQSGCGTCLRSTEHCASGIKWLATQNRWRRCRRTRRPGTPCWPSSCPGAPGSPFPSRSRPSAAASSSSGAQPLPSSSRPLSSLRAPCSTSPWFASTRASSATRPATARPPSGSCTAA